LPHRFFLFSSYLFIWRTPFFKGIQHDVDQDKSSFKLRRAAVTIHRRLANLNLMHHQHKWSGFLLFSIESAGTVPLALGLLSLPSRSDTFMIHLGSNLSFLLLQSRCEQFPML